MTNNQLTREENVQAVFDLKAGYTLGLADVEILKRVARMALAALDSEPVAVPDHLTYLQNPTLENVLSDAEENSPMAHAARILAREVKFWRSAPLYRHAQPAPGKYNIGDATMRHIFTPTGMTNVSDMQAVFDRIEAVLVGMEQPAPVVPDDVLEALQKVARIRLDLNDFDGDRRGIADCLGDAEEALIEVVNRRAAMLQGAKNSESRVGIQTAPALDSFKENADARCGNSPVIPEGYVMVPMEPTKEMLRAHVGMKPKGWDVQLRKTWAAMLAAAPQEVPDGK